MINLYASCMYENCINSQIFYNETIPAVESHDKRPQNCDKIFPLAKRHKKTEQAPDTPKRLTPLMPTEEQEARFYKFRDLCILSLDAKCPLNKRTNYILEAFSLYQESRNLQDLVHTRRGKSYIKCMLRHVGSEVWEQLSKLLKEPQNNNTQIQIFNMLILLIDNPAIRTSVFENTIQYLKCNQLSQSVLDRLSHRKTIG